MDIEEIQNLIKELIEKINIKTTGITASKDNGMSTWFSVEVNEPHFFITHEGEALHALNHLVRRILEGRTTKTEVVDNNPNNAILIDINGFQKKRVDATRAIAHMMGERARYFKSNIEIDPMSSFERKVVHEFLSDATDLKTESVGFGPTRRVVIKYIGSI